MALWSSIFETSLFYLSFCSKSVLSCIRSKPDCLEGREVSRTHWSQLPRRILICHLLACENEQEFRKSSFYLVGWNCLFQAVGKWHLSSGHHISGMNPLSSPALGTPGHQSFHLELELRPNSDTNGYSQHWSTCHSNHSKDRKHHNSQ